MLPHLTINQVKTFLLCMAADKNVSPIQIQTLNGNLNWKHIW
jgi:hypothetical protein